MDHHYQGHSFELLVLPRPVELGAGVLAINLPISVVITGCDSLPVLEQVFDAARSFRPLTEQEVRAILIKTANLESWSEHEAYKSATIHDRTARSPEWLGEKAA
jgi:hypothetical protein